MLPPRFSKPFERFDEKGGTKVEVKKLDSLNLPRIDPFKASERPEMKKYFNVVAWPEGELIEPAR